jgi:small subunit ribosomal protein S4e
MPRGPKHHLKRINAPKHWMLDKLGGIFAPRPSSGPHKLRECLPLTILLRNRLKYALTGREVTQILMGRHIRVDGKVRTDATFPAGFMDVVNIEKTKENFRLLYNVKGKFTLHKISPEEAGFKLLKVKRCYTGKKGVPAICCHDGRTIRYPHPSIRKHDSVKFNLKTNKIEETIKFGVGSLIMVTGGKNLGRVGQLKSVEKHDGSDSIVHIEDIAKNSFTTRIDNIFVIGQGKKANVTLPRGGGIALTPIEERDQKAKTKNSNKAK